MNRKDYWNTDYYQYWKETVNKANTTNESEKPTVSDETISGLIRPYLTGKTLKLLDFGCGFGRFYPFFKHFGVDYYGIDISSNMLDVFKNAYPEVDGRIFEAEGESLPFPDHHFNIVFAVGVFDATYQDEALSEMFRVLKQEGVIILSGKNEDYPLDDKEAEIAEMKAREKGHPNHFTKVHKLISQCYRQDVEITEQYYYDRRGDFPANNFTNKLPDRFYEYVLILKKQDRSKKVFKNIYSPYSSRFYER